MIYFEEYKTCFLYYSILDPEEIGGLYVVFVYNQI